MSEKKSTYQQFTTFYLGERFYGIDVMQVQEVTKPLPLTPVRLAPRHIKGLINLRGQIATAIGLRELFGLDSVENESESMTVVCKVQGNLLALLVDKIGDVVEAVDKSFESTPDTVPIAIRKVMKGVYKTEDGILSVIGVENLTEELNRNQK